MKSMIRLFVLLIFIIGLLAPLTSNIHSEPLEPKMNVHFIDVGQGDSVLVETPSNKVILIDGGPPKAGEKVLAYLKKLQINKIDLLIATHPDIDHIGGLPKIIKSIKVDQIIDSGKVHTTKTYARYIYQIHKQKIPIQSAKENRKINIDPLLDIRVLNTYERTKNNNQSSIVLKVGFNKMDFLFMSDVEKEQEEKLLKKYNLEADIVKVAHHGSKTSSSLAFLRKVNPKIALITYSKKNKYGHPVNRVIENLNKMNVDIYSTATYGNVVVTTNGKRYFIFPEKSPADALVEAIG